MTVIAAAIVTLLSNDTSLADVTPDPASQGRTNSAFTRKVTIGEVKKYLRDAKIVEWGKLRRVDSDEGDTMCSSSMGQRGADRRDATFVRVRLPTGIHQAVNC